MRVNVYAEEMTERVEIISKSIEGNVYTGLRLYLELPVTHKGEQIKGPFMHHPGDDDSSAITFWGKQDLRVVLRKMLAELDEHYENHSDGLAALGKERTYNGDIVAWIRRRAENGPVMVSAKLGSEIADYIELLERKAGVDTYRR